MSDPSTATTQRPSPELPPPDSAMPFSQATAPSTSAVEREAEAEAMSGLRIHRDPSLTTDATSADPVEGDPRSRIEWVRPTDLVARVSARASERGVEWNTRAHEWAMQQTRATITESRAKAASLGRSVRTTLTRTGTDPAEQEVARL